MAAAAALLFAIVIQITTNRGTLTVETSSEGYSTTVQGETILIREVSTGKQIKVRLGENSVSPGEYEILVQNLPNGITFSAPRFSIFRGGEKQVEVMFQPKAVARVSETGSESNGTPPEPGMALADKESVISAITEDPIIVVKNPLPKLPANTPMNPEALVTSPIKLPGIQSWTMQVAEESMPLSPPAVSGDGQWIAALGWNGSVRVWRTDSLDKPQILCDHIGNVGTVSWSPDGKHLATSSRSPVESDNRTGRILVRDTDDFRVAYEIPATANRIQWSPSGRQFAFVNSIGRRVSKSELWIFDTVTESVSRTDVKFLVWAEIEWSSNSQLLAVSSTKTVKVFEADSLRLRSTLDVNAVDFRWNAEASELFVQSVPKGLGKISVGADNGRSVSQFRFEKWNIVNETVISTQDKTLIGQKSVHWSNNGQPYIVEWPEIIDSLSEEDAAAPPKDRPAIQMQQVFGDGTKTLPALPVNSKASASFLTFSGDSQQIACATASGLYLLDRAGQNEDWQWVAGMGLSPNSYYSGSDYNKGTLRFAWAEATSYRNPRTILARKAELDIESLNLTAKDTTWPIEQYKAVDPSGRFVAELKISSSEETTGYQLLHITDKSMPDASPQEFLLSRPSKSYGRHVPKWSSDGQLLAAVVKKDGRALQLFRVDESGKNFVSTAAPKKALWSEGDSFAWAPEGHTYARTTSDAGPVVVDLKTEPIVERLPLDPGVFRPPPVRNRGGSSPSSPQASFFLWVDSQTLFGSVKGSLSAGRQKFVCYLWRKTADGWSIAQRFDGYVMDIAFRSPDKTRLVFGPVPRGYSKSSEVKIANLNNGLVRTIQIESVDNPDYKYRKVLGWIDEDHLWIDFANGSESHIGSFSLLNGQTSVLPKSGSFALMPNGFCRFVRNELQFYDPQFRLTSSIVISSNERAAGVSPDGPLRVNAKEPCSILYVALLDDGTQVTLTPQEFKQRFGQTLPDEFFDKASLQQSK